MIAIIVAAISCLGTIASVIYSWRNNATGIKNDIINTYEKRLKQIDEDMQSLKDKLDEVSAKLDKSEADRKKAEDTLHLRNPEFERYMALSLRLLTEIHSAVLPQTVSSNN